jgi:hypothetical protein
LCSGGLDQERFAMPGCCRGRNRRLRSQNDHSEVDTMDRRGVGRGVGGGKGQGRGGQGPGRRGGSLAAGPAGYCLCPQCGQREAHERGIPCVERTCPKCGTEMVRQ